MINSIEVPTTPGMTKSTLKGTSSHKHIMKKGVTERYA